MLVCGLLLCVLVCMLQYCDGETPPVVEFRSSSKLERVMLSILLGSITGLGCALASACFVRFIFRYVKKSPVLKGPVVFSPQISPKSLQSALANQSLVSISSSSSSRYFKAVLDNGFTVAVKTLDVDVGSNMQRRTQKELERLAGLRHRHLMSLRAYVSEPTTASAGRFRLVYDYVPTGSLEDAMMNQPQLQLGWDARLRIAVGIIKGLQYLHFNCNPRMLHYNLKPSNVLLDADFEPRLGDCGLANLTTPAAAASLDDDRIGSLSYYAPECFPNFSIYTEKSDIFSFGMILGILVTGRRSRGNMGMWFREVMEGGDGREVIDKTLLIGGGEEEISLEDEMLMLLRIAAVCLSDIPADRPSADELVPMLTQLHSF